MAVNPDPASAMTLVTLLLAFVVRVGILSRFKVKFALASGLFLIAS